MPASADFLWRGVGSRKVEREKQMYETKGKWSEASTEAKNEYHDTKWRRLKERVQCKWIGLRPEIAVTVTSLYPPENPPLYQNARKRVRAAAGRPRSSTTP